jgi:very-short-patch-repair endonuclease
VRGANEKRTRRARQLRREETEPERKLWRRLSNRQLAGWKFVRQEPIVPYFADFACREAKLVVELDGGQHAESEHDRVRDTFLVSCGYRVLRFWNYEAMRNMQSVLDTIFAALGGENISCVGGEVEAAQSAEPGEGVSAIALNPEPAPHPLAAAPRVGLSPQAGRGGRRP